MTSKELNIIQLSDKGQVVVPAAIRKKLGWPNGCYLLINVEQNAVVMKNLTPDELHKALASGSN